VKRALWLILGISIFGLLFSGALTYRELFAESSAACPFAGSAATVFGDPPCVYGVALYLAIAGTAGAGLISAQRSRARAANDGRPGAHSTARTLNGAATP
jgi:hypothetical protein